MIETLMTQHRELRVRLARISSLVELGQTDALVTALADMKGLLLTHLELEDGRLYPSMALMTSGMKKTVQVVTAETYRLNMQGVSTSLLAFFERYSAGFDLADFGSGLEAQTIAFVAKQTLDVAM